MDKPTRFDSIPAGCVLAFEPNNRGDFVFDAENICFVRSSCFTRNWPVLRPAPAPAYPYGSTLPWDLKIPEGWEPAGDWCDAGLIRIPENGEWYLGRRNGIYIAKQATKDDPLVDPRLILRRVPKMVTEVTVRLEDYKGEPEDLVNFKVEIPFFSIPAIHGVVTAVREVPDAG
jgi:hypothetical protein